MATEVYTPEPVQGHRMKPDIEIDEQGVTWLLIETNYGSYKANHATMTAPPPVADPISVRMGFDPGSVDPSRVLWGKNAYATFAPEPKAYFDGVYIGKVL
ncbi:hypothetical protein SEA_ROSIEPOSIE_87 [Arthrobacter phage RosiePosie]|uniref:Uncharacterized protein n=12 Tax=Klausavirus princesstrina TaxID=1984784 RepID=A0A286N4A0_9CAUD|nr:hypothetical protein FDI82_gp088 [Arthrobacter phage PrincessTrina]AOZ64750.1 hypothetical protein SEA_CHOCOLAT_87 [Arthrobacter phage Chocolat]APC44769.1 hypothetical protein SEA_EDGARPOE_86 [Arthrobacter phage EdgarPoe]APC44881.1 hypothetical protein SEA_HUMPTYDUMPTY_87 [Arthrobacter phage HumptyDumpty]ASX98871.1 hypothetical protein SEA_KABREEZE_87 [Arthrobacter phage Kabreeze]ASX98982.1 hypothetical protein SEA_ROSIEPOSIE_87 [Arthrobacter phage RosiePosie]ASX99095.1 hypothetical protei